MYTAEYMEYLLLSAQRLTVGAVGCCYMRSHCLLPGLSEYSFDSNTVMSFHSSELATNYDLNIMYQQGLIAPRLRPEDNHTGQVTSSHFAYNISGHD